MWCWGQVQKLCSCDSSSIGHNVGLSVPCPSSADFMNLFEAFLIVVVKVLEPVFDLEPQQGELVLPIIANSGHNLSLIS